MKPNREIAATRANGRCELSVGNHAEGCSQIGEHAHHRKPRSVGGSDDHLNLLMVSHLCHQKIHDNNEWAYGLAYLLKSHEPITRKPK